MNTTQKIEFVKNFISTWDAAEQEDGFPKEVELCELFESFCKENNLPHMSANEVLNQLVMVA
jgi:hypothetical protein